jgi:hypothetical protein
VPFSFETPSGDRELFDGGLRPQIRTVDIEGQVIDLASMKEQFERSRSNGG